MRKGSGWRRTVAVVAAAAAAATGLSLAGTATASGAGAAGSRVAPIKHLIVIFDENVSFDHYFGTYPHAADPPGEPAFHAAPGTPTVNGLTGGLLHHNPNLANPQRLDRSQPLTCDQDHDYTAEQLAFDHGAMDRFVQDTQNLSCSPPDISRPGLVMDYYDGNTVTALWNYAQRFAMSDNFYDTTFGPSTPGALNLISGQTHGVRLTAPDPTAESDGTLFGDEDPTFDDCSSTAYPTASMSGRNVGDLLNAKGVSWGWFEGGFAPTTPYSRKTGAKAVCASAHTNVGGAAVTDYIPHHEPFQYYRSTANPHHLAPTGLAEIGHNGRANHQYDLSWFYRAVAGGHLPAVSFLKAAGYQDGHAGYSDPLDEQYLLVKVMNSVERSPYWRSTAIVVTYDDSDGWYDQAISVVNHSHDPATDALTGKGNCGTGGPVLGGYQARCGHGPRLPLLVISPYARTNFVDNTMTDQSSVLRFIEDNWRLGRIGHGSFDAIAGSLNSLFDWTRPRFAPLLLNQRTGEPMH